MQIHFRLSWPGTLWTALSRQLSQNLGSFSHETPLSLSLFCSVVWWERVRLLNGVACLCTNNFLPKFHQAKTTFQLSSINMKTGKGSNFACPSRLLKKKKKENVMGRWLIIAYEDVNWYVSYLNKCFSETWAYMLI